MRNNNYIEIGTVLLRSVNNIRKIKECYWQFYLRISFNSLQYYNDHFGLNIFFPLKKKVELIL